MLKAMVETLDGVDDALKPFYTEADGKFVLAVEDPDNLPAVINLKNAYERTKADKASASQRAKDLEAQLAELSRNRPDEAAIVKARKELEDQIAAERARAEKAEAQLVAVTRDRALTEALASAGVTIPQFQEAARRLLADKVRVDGDSIVVDAGMGPVPVAEHVKKWAASDGSVFVTPPAGAGAKGSGHAAGSGQVYKRAEFDALSIDRKMTVIKEGAKVVD